MQTVLLIRHAKAIDREEWDQPDELRPLTLSGRRQAERIADRWGGLTIASIKSSPAVRCLQTVQPLADRSGIRVAVSASLMEGCPITLPPTSAHGVHVICAHGDNIPQALRALGLPGDQCRKGSVWTLERDANGSICSATYSEVDKANT